MKERVPTTEYNQVIQHQFRDDTYFSSVDGMAVSINVTVSWTFYGNSFLVGTGKPSDNPPLVCRSGIQGVWGGFKIL